MITIKIGIGGFMFVPEFFYGNYKNVEKRMNSICKGKKSLAKVKNIYDEINRDTNDKIYHDDFLISLSDTYIGQRLQNAYYPFIFSSYITYEENDNSDIIKWFKEKSIENKWCQLSALADNPIVQFLYNDREYSRLLGNSICSNWDFYMSFGEVFCFCPIYEKQNNKYYFWEYNLALSKILFSILKKEVIKVEEYKNFPMIWKRYVR